MSIWNWMHRPYSNWVTYQTNKAVAEFHKNLTAEAEKKLVIEYDNDVLTSVYADAKKFQEGIKFNVNELDEARWAIPKIHKKPYAVNWGDLTKPLWEGSIGATVKIGTPPVFKYNLHTDLLNDGKYEEYHETVMKEARVKNDTDWRWNAYGKKVSLDGIWEYDDNGGMWRTSYGMTLIDGKYSSPDSRVYVAVKEFS